MEFNNSYRSRFYSEYHRMGSNSYRSKVRFYEENKNELQYLDYEDRIDVDLDYLLCLFEIGKYHKFLHRVDPMIELVVTDNIYQYNGVDIFRTLLFRKAACQYNTGQFIKSEKVLKQLVKIQPDNKDARSLFGRCKRKRDRRWHDGAKAVAMVMLLSAVSITFMEMLVVRSFYTDYLNFFTGLRNFLFGGALLLLVGNEVYLKYNIGKEIGYDWGVKESWQLVENGYRRAFRSYFH